MRHRPLLSCPQLPTAPDVQNLPGEREPGRGSRMHFNSLPGPEHLSARSSPRSSDISHTLCIQPRSDTCATLAPTRSCQGYFQTLAPPWELGFSLGPHSFLASSLPLGCPDEVAERFFKGKSVRQYSPTTSPRLALVVSKIPFPITPLGNCSLPSHCPCKRD